MALPAKPFHNTRADGFARTPNPVGHRPLLSFRKAQAGLVDLKKYPIGPLEDVQDFERACLGQLFSVL